MMAIVLPGCGGEVGVDGMGVRGGVKWMGVWDWGGWGEVRGGVGCGYRQGWGYGWIKYGIDNGVVDGVRDWG